MKDIRIGNDIIVSWSIFAEGAPYSLEGKEVTLYLCSQFGKRRAEGYAITGNQITWTFFGKEQKHSGKYSLELVINEDAEGMVTTDACDFVNLVNCTCKVGGADDAGVQTESIELTSNLEYVANAGGGGSYEDIKTDISDLKEKDIELDTKLTELSADVAELSERVDELGEGASDVFKAEYGVTTIEEIVAAYNEGKIIHCDYENFCYTLSRFSAGEAYFSSVKDNFSYRLYCSSKSQWSKASFPLELISNKVTSLSDKSTDTQYPSAKAVYDAIQQMMPATPSGDPMHYMFEAVGATYNATDEDIPMVGIYGDSYVHKAKHWHLNELGDLTNEEMRTIYLEMYPIASQSMYAEWFAYNKKSRTNLSQCVSDAGAKGYSYTFYSTTFKTLKLGITENALISSMSYTFAYSSKLEKILTTLNVSYTSGAVSTPFQNCNALKYVRLKGLKVSMPMNTSKNLSNDSILYMIQNEAAASAITITLHADAYDRAMADADIQAALAEHPNVSLAK